MLTVNFWGVRGSTPCPCDANRRYGGNTACVVLSTPGRDPILLDLGTGLRFYGESLGPEPFRGSVFVTHLHWDHVQGLPFFVPINRPGAELDVYAPAQDGVSVEEAFGEFMRPPYFPVRATDLAGDIRFHDASSTEVRVGDATVLVRDVPHVGATNGYRVTIDGVSVAYLSDHQQPVDAPTSVAESVLELCDGADLVIHDAQFTSDDFAAKSNWGHCTSQYAVEVAAQAGARRLALFHHDPSRHDAGVERLLAEARELGARRGLEEVLAASEGLTIALSPRPCLDPGVLARTDRGEAAPANGTGSAGHLGSANGHADEAGRRSPNGGGLADEARSVATNR